MAKIKIDPQFSDLISHCTAEQDSEFEANVLTDGKILERPVVWKHQNILLDGHRRYKLTVKHPSLKMPAPIILDFEDRQAAHNWIIDHQLSKRNISDEQRRYLIGKKYREEKPALGSNQFIQEGGGSIRVTDPLTASKIAEKEDISEISVRRAADFAEAVDAVAENLGKEVKNAILNGDVTASTETLATLAKLPKKQRTRLAKRIALGEVTNIAKELKADEESEGGYEPHEAAKPLADLKKALAASARHFGTVKTILGKRPLLDEIFEGIDQATRAMTKLTESIKRSERKK